MVLKAFKFRCYPNGQQISFIQRTFGCCRFVFNELLAEQKRKESYWFIVNEMVQNGQLSQNNWKSSLFNKVENVKKLPSLKKEYPFLNEVDSIALQATVENLADGFDRFYKKQNKKPQFKTKKNIVQSYTTKFVNGNIRIEGNIIRLPRIGKIRFAKSREVNGVIKRVTIRQNATGKYFISVLAEVEEKPMPKTKNACGIDMGLKNFLTLSDGTVVANPRYFATLEKKLQKEQRILSRRIRLALNSGIPLHDAKNVQKQRIKVAKLHEKIYNKRQDFLQKLSTDIIKNHDVICIESLSIKKMLGNKHYSKSILDASWFKFFEMLEYKAIWYGRTIVPVGLYFPSSQMCSTCGTINPVLKDTTIRHWICKNCNSEHDRDHNSAKNILFEGLRLLT